MNRSKLISAALFALIASQGAGLAGSNDPAGVWMVRWDGNAQNENALTLAVRTGRLSGTYSNDDKAACTVTGNHKEQTRELALTIVCPKWDIRMQGTASEDWKTASGGYQAYVNSQGQFTMRKK